MEYIPAIDPRCQKAQGGYDNYSQGIIVGGSPKDLPDAHTYSGSWILFEDGRWANVHANIRPGGIHGVRWIDQACPKCNMPCSFSNYCPPCNK